METERIEAFGKLLKMLRKERNYRQEELAEWLGVKRQTYSHYETGRILPPTEAICKIAELYKIDQSKLLNSLYNPMEEKQEPVTVEEKELLKAFRELDNKDRMEILEICKIKQKIKNMLA